MEYLVAPEEFRTERFVVRSYRIDDGAAVSEAVNESYEHLRPWMSWVTPVQDVTESQRLVRQFRAKYLLAEEFFLGIFAPDDRRLLGGTGFHLREGALSTGCAELGMWIRAREAGRGLGTKALAAVVQWGFSDWPWQRLSWRCDDRNGASRRVAEKVGLRLEGTLRGQAAEVGPGRRDTLCFGLTRSEWNLRSAPCTTGT